MGEIRGERLFWCKIIFSFNDASFISGRNKGCRWILRQGRARQFHGFKVSRVGNTLVLINTCTAVWDICSRIAIVPVLTVRTTKVTPHNTRSKIAHVHQVRAQVPYCFCVFRVLQRSACVKKIYKVQDDQVLRE